MSTMSKAQMRLHFLLLVLLCCITPSSFFTMPFFFNSPIPGLVACGRHQIQALIDFKSEFETHQCNHNDPFNVVLCDEETSAITVLRLRACLSGTLKPNSSLFRMHHLRYLHLSQNNFASSSLPSEFGNLKRLDLLSLSNNGFIGQVPSSFSNLKHLSGLNLSNNELTGSFPLVGNLTKLVVLDLSNNHFSGALSPSCSLFEFQNLRYLDLSFNNFRSSLPSEFGNLNRLESLDLSSNDLFGHVPPTISNLTRLTLLSLDHNKFTGSFPLVQNLTNLFVLRLGDNHFSGTVPSSLLAMHFLSFLDLRGNNLSDSIGFLNSSLSSNLETVLLGKNHFGRQILEPISKLISLKYLDVSFLNTNYPVDISMFSSLKDLVYLDLSGNSIPPASLKTDSYIPPNLKTLFLSNCGINEFPTLLKTLKKLEFIKLSDNRIKGKVPEWLWNLPHLSFVSIANNSFDGFQGPGEVLVNTSLKDFDLQQNCFTGAIHVLPLSISVLAADENRFTGSIPLSICKCRSLTDLSLAKNNLTGPIPHCLSNLAFLNLRMNNLDGSIPDMFHAGASLQSLDVSYNQLTGKLPRSLVKCSSLRFLSVDHNKIQDTFPFWLKALPNLQVLVLRSNEFRGSISPPDQGSLGFPELRILEVSDNKLTGSLPSRYFENWKASSLMLNGDGGLYMAYAKNTQGMIGYTYTDAIDLHYKGLSMDQQRVLTSYATIDFSGNKLEGQIPESIGLLKALIALNLSNNDFSGHIPMSLANLTELESLDLSSNQLSGTIPNGLGSLSFLAYINVSHNQLYGEIPQGTQIMGQPISSFEGNAGLCGFPLKDSCFGTPPGQQPKGEDDEEEGEGEVLSWKAVANGYGVGMLLGLTIAQVIASFKPEWLTKIIGLYKLRNH